MEKKLNIPMGDRFYDIRYIIQKDTNVALVKVWVDYEELNVHTGKEFEYMVRGYHSGTFVTDYGSGFNPKENMDTKNAIVAAINRAEEINKISLS